MFVDLLIFFFGLLIYSNSNKVVIVKLLNEYKVEISKKNKLLISTYFMDVLLNFENYYFYVMQSD